MPLVIEPHVCDADGCEEETFYYKEVFIPYSEGIPVGKLRTARGIKARLFLCPVHYNIDEPGMFTIHITNAATYGLQERDF